MIMGLVFSFVPELKGWLEGFVVMPFLYYYCRVSYTGKWGHTLREMGRCGKRWND